MMNSDPDIPEWDKTRQLLRKHLAAPKLEHPDFVNSRVLEAIDRLDRNDRKQGFFPLRRLALAGVFGLLAAAVLTGVFLPEGLRSNGEGEFLSQVINAQPANPNLSVSSFRAPGDRGVVLWIEGTEYIPANQPVM